MRTLTRRSLLTLAAGALFLGAAAPAMAQKSLDWYVQPSLSDLSAHVTVLSKSDGELRKIGKGYVDVYGLAKQEIFCKAPDGVLFQGKKGLFTVRNVTYKGRKLLEVPTLRYRKVEDISKEPSKGYSISDLGVVSSSWAATVQDRYLRSEQRDGKTVHVFEFWYKEDPRYKHTIVMDPSTKTMLEHTAHHRNPKKPGFKKKFVYSEPTQVSGVWLPTKVQLINGENKVAATMRYGNLRVNSGLDEKQFTF